MMAPIQTPQTAEWPQRPAHIDAVASLKENGQIIAGGAILNDDDQMIGSTLYVDFESREVLDTWLNNDPYITGNVWQDISVQPIRLAVKQKRLNLAFGKKWSQESHYFD